MPLCTVFYKSLLTSEGQEYIQHTLTFNFTKENVKLKFIIYIYCRKLLCLYPECHWNIACFLATQQEPGTCGNVVLTKVALPLSVCYAVYGHKILFEKVASSTLSAKRVIRMSQVHRNGPLGPLGTLTAITHSCLLHKLAPERPVGVCSA